MDFCRPHKCGMNFWTNSSLAKALFDAYLIQNVFSKYSSFSLLFLGLYIDDLILISGNLQYILVHKVVFAQRFSMTDNNDTEYILGIQIWLNSKATFLTLSQDKYIFDMLLKFNVTTCKPIVLFLKQEFNKLSVDGEFHNDILDA